MFNHPRFAADGKSCRGSMRRLAGGAGAPAGGSARLNDPPEDNTNTLNEWLITFAASQHENGRTGRGRGRPGRSRRGGPKQTVVANLAADSLEVDWQGRD